MQTLNRIGKLKRKADYNKVIKKEKVRASKEAARSDPITNPSANQAVETHQHLLPEDYARPLEMALDSVILDMEDDKEQKNKNKQKENQQPENTFEYENPEYNA